MYINENNDDNWNLSGNDVSNLKITEYFREKEKFNLAVLFVLFWRDANEAWNF